MFSLIHHSALFLFLPLWLLQRNQLLSLICHLDRGIIYDLISQ